MHSTVRTPDWLQRRASTHGDDTSLIYRDQNWTFAALARRVEALDQVLAKRGLAPGQVVATLLPNGPGLVGLLHAVPRGGRIVAPLGIRLQASEVETMLTRCGAAIVIYDDTTQDLAGSLRADLDAVHIDQVWNAPVARTTESSSIATIGLDTHHSIVFTSGTSGPPKGVYLTWANHLWSAMGSALNLGLAPNDRWLLCMPLNHVGGLSILMRSVLYGHAVEVQERFTPEAVNEAIDERAITIVSVVANMLQRTLDRRHDRRFPPSLRAILVGGGPVPRSLLERCAAIGAPVLPTYGLSETASQIATARPGEAIRSGCVGNPLLFAEIQIGDGTGGTAEAGDAGQIQVRGPMISPGYVGESTARDPADWLSTRDEGWIDEAGKLYVLGRSDDTIISGGENIHPGEIERALERHSAVLEAFASGVADEQWGQVVYAAVRCSAPVEESELLDHCRLHLANYKVPRHIRCVAEFPRTAAGKIARRLAFEQLQINPKNSA